MARLRPIILPLIASTLSILAATWLACGDDSPAGPDNNNNSGPPPLTVDSIPPAEINSLVCGFPGAGSLALQWFAPGDDNSNGTADAYDIRYSKTEIFETSWEQAERFTDAPDPETAGRVQSCRITGLDSNVEYFFKIKTRDESGNESGLSNEATGIPGQEYMPPSAVTDLFAIAIDSTTFLLTWTAPGDDGTIGTATRYDIRYAVHSGVNNSNWANAVQVDNEPTPKPAGEADSLVVTVTEAHTNHGFALKSSDEVPNEAEISNVCLALGEGSYLWTYPYTVRQGNQLTIIYRSSGIGRLIVELQYGWAGTTCGNRDVRLFDGYPVEGTHLINFDFYNPGTNDYYRTGTYHIYVCVGGAEVGYARAEFTD